MDTLTARPRLLKQANLSLIRRAIKTKGTATRAEIAAETNISSTTVRSLLAEMMANGEIESIGLDASSGGRKAERYQFKPDRYHGAVLCIVRDQIHAMLVDVCGNISDRTRLDIQNGDYVQAVDTYLDDLILHKEIKSIGIGVPGIVDGGSYLIMKRGDENLQRFPLGDHVTQRYHLPVILENDINATAIGFERCYEKEFPDEVSSNTNMAYLHFDPDCVSAGFIAGGKIIRGHNNFAGELSLIPMQNGKALDQTLANAMNDVEYTDYIIQIISWVCAILNPQYVLLGGPSFRKSCLGPISDGLTGLLPKRMYATVLYSPDILRDYYEGMASLTAGKMFDEVQFIKE